MRWTLDANTWSVHRNISVSVNSQKVILERRFSFDAGSSWYSRAPEPIVSLVGPYFNVWYFRPYSDTALAAVSKTVVGGDQTGSIHRGVEIEPLLAPVLAQQL
jgi:hypothetical protein